MTPLSLQAGRYKFTAITHETYDNTTFIVAKGFRKGLKACSYYPHERKYKLNTFLDSTSASEVDRAVFLEHLLNRNVLVINDIKELPVIGQPGKRIFHFDWAVESSEEYQEGINERNLVNIEHAMSETELMELRDGFLTDDYNLSQQEIELRDGFLIDDYNVSQGEIDLINGFLSNRGNNNAGDSKDTFDNPEDDLYL